MLIRALLPHASCVLLIVAGWGGCRSDAGSSGNPDARPAAFRDADIYDTADAPVIVIEEDAPPALPECPATCDDKNPCTLDSCDPDTHLCRNDPGNDGVACASTDLCALAASCQDGLCVGRASKDCSRPPDQCHEAGTCDNSTGLCIYPSMADSTPCSDDNLCTTTDRCIAGVCTGTAVQCGPGVACDTKTGVCPGFPTASWGVAMDPDAAMRTAVDDTFTGLAMSATGALYFVGGFANTLDLGAGAMSTTSNPGLATTAWDFDAFIARLDPDTGRAKWSRSFGDRMKQTAGAVAVNGRDVVMVTGIFNGRFDVGAVDGVDGGTLSFTNSTAYVRAFLVALDGVSGKVLWARATDVAGNDSWSYFRGSVAADPSDNNFVLCTSPTAAATGLGVTSAAGGNKSDALVAKLNAETGEVMWKGQYGTTSEETCDAVAVDSGGKVYVTGRLSAGGAIDFGNGVSFTGPKGAAQRSMYLAQLDGLTGKGLWGKTFSGAGDLSGALEPKTIATDNDAVWVGGSFLTTAVFGEYSLVPASKGSKSAFVAAFAASSGTVAWAQNWGSGAAVTSLAPTSAKNLIVVGYYGGLMSFETGSLPDGSATGQAPFAAKLDATSGVAQAARGYASVTGAATSSFPAVVVDKAGATSKPGAPFVIGSTSTYANGIDLGAPVGLVRFDTLDAGAHSLQTLFLLRYEP